MCEGLAGLRRIVERSRDGVRAVPAAGLLQTHLCFSEHDKALG